MNNFVQQRHPNLMVNFAIFFLFGGTAYVVLELLWRGRSHVSMFIVGGLAFVLLDSIFMRHQMSLPIKCLTGTAIITALEFTAGYIVNIRMGLGVWDYSQMPLNLYGQICLPYSLLWAALTLPIAYISRLLHGIF